MKYTITWRECSILKSLRICGLAFVIGCCQGKSRPLEPSVATKPSPTTGVAVAADRDVFAGVPGDPFCGFFGDPLRGGVIILWRQGDGYGGILATDFAWDFEGKQTDGVIHGRWFKKDNPSVSGGPIDVRLAVGGVTVGEKGTWIQLPRWSTGADWDKATRSWRK